MNIILNNNITLSLSLSDILTNDWQFTGKIKYVKADSYISRGSIKCGILTKFIPEKVYLFVEIKVSRFFGLFGYTNKWIDCDDISILENTII